MTAAARPDRRRSADGQVVGALLITAGIAWLLQRSGIASMAWETLLSALLILLGAGLLLTAGRRGGIGLIVLGVAMTAVLASNSSLDVGILKEGVGDRVTRPATIATARRESQLGVGSLHADLTDLAGELSDGETRLNYRVGIGKLNIILPPVEANPDVKVKVVVNIEGGDLEMLGLQRSGQEIEETYEQDGFAEAPKQLVVGVSMVFGNVQVDRAPF